MKKIFFNVLLHLPALPRGAAFGKHRYGSAAIANENADIFLDIWTKRNKKQNKKTKQMLTWLLCFRY